MKTLALRLVAVAAMGLFTLVLAEIGLRVSSVWIGRHSDTMFAVLTYDPQIGWKMKPSSVERVDFVDVEGIPVRSNRDGFWDRDHAVERSGSGCRIAFFGDSFTWGMGLRDEERFTSLLETRGRGWETMNFGIPAYGTDQSLLVWRHYGARYRPDVAVLTIYQNDYLDNMYYVRYGRRKPFFEMKEGGRMDLHNSPVDPTDFWVDGIYNQPAPMYTRYFANPVERRSRVTQWLGKNSELVRVTYTLARGRPADLLAEPPVASAATLPANQPLSEAEEAQVRLLHQIVLQFAREVQDSGARFQVVLAGAPMTRYDLHRQLLTQAGIPYVDATTERLEPLIGPGDRVYFRYSGHWTPPANRVVADMVAERLRGADFCGARA